MLKLFQKSFFKLARKLFTTNKHQKTNHRGRTKYLFLILKEGMYITGKIVCFVIHRGTNDSLGTSEMRLRI